MAEIKKDDPNIEDEEVQFYTDEEGNGYYIHKIVPVGDKSYAILVCVDESDFEDEPEEGSCKEAAACGCGCSGCGGEVEEDDEDCEVEIARIEMKDGEECFIFIDPEDPEYEAVCKAYEALMDEEECDA